MRKTPEQVLTEWAEQEFTLDLGTGTKVYSDDDFCRLCIALGLDGQRGLEPLIKKEITNENLRRAYTTAWERLVSVILSMRDDQQAADILNRTFSPYSIAHLSNLVDFEDYFEQVLLTELGVRDGMKLGTYANIAEDRLKRVLTRVFMPRGETRLHPGYIYAPYIPNSP